MKSKLYIAGILLTVFLVVLTSNSYGKIKTLPVADMVSKAEYIVISEAYQITKTGYLRSNKLSYLKNELKIIESLKGELLPDESIVINTVKGENWIEDNVELPLPGSKVFLFLKKNEKGEFRPVNGIQGVWPMQGDKLLGMGTRYKVDDIREMIQKIQ